MDSVDFSSEILNEHRKLMFITGKFSDFQIKNLETYPQIVFDNIKKIEIEYDIQPNTGKGYVKYKVKLTQKQDNLDTRINHLQIWVKQLLFNEVEVIVEVKNAPCRKKRN